MPGVQSTPSQRRGWGLGSCGRFDRLGLTSTQSSGLVGDLSLPPVCLASLQRSFHHWLAGHPSLLPSCWPCLFQAQRQAAGPSSGLQTISFSPATPLPGLTPREISLSYWSHHADLLLIISSVAFLSFMKTTCTPWNSLRGPSWAACQPGQPLPPSFSSPGTSVPHADTRSSLCRPVRWLMPLLSGTPTWALPHWWLLHSPAEPAALGDSPIHHIRIWARRSPPYSSNHCTHRSPGWWHLGLRTSRLQGPTQMIGRNMEADV